MKIILVIGLPCSGKTHLAEQRANEFRAILLDDASKKFTKDEMKFKILLGYQEDRDVILTDPYFCRENTRRNFRDWVHEFDIPVKVEYIFFENDADKCLNNMRHRMAQGDDRKVEGAIRTMTRTYEIPDGVEPLEIWQPEGD